MAWRPLSWSLSRSHLARLLLRLRNKAELAQRQGACLLLSAPSNDRLSRAREKVGLVVDGAGGLRRRSLARVARILIDIIYMYSPVARKRRPDEGDVSAAALLNRHVCSAP